MAEPRPKRYPPPEFPPRRPALFAKTPPAIFGPILGLIGLGLALRGIAPIEGLAELVLGLVSGLWLFAVVAIKVKVWRRFSVLWEDLRPLPGRAGLAAGSMTGMAMAGVIAPYAPGLAIAVALASVVAHLVLAGMVLRVMARAEGPEVNPTWQLSFTGPIVAALPLIALGQRQIGLVLVLAATGTALAIWALSLRQLWREEPPAPLRPLLAIHLSPAALLSLGYGALGVPEAQLGFLVVAVVIALALMARMRWLLASGVTPVWGALTFPLAALAQALLVWEPLLGQAVTLVACGVIPWIAWRVLKLWPGGQLAARTNAAEA